MGHRFTNTPAEVSARMRLIRSKNTKPELRLFSMLSAAGIKFTSHRQVAGITVDAAIGRDLLVFVDSPFWHLRDLADLKRMSPYWQWRLIRNRQRDYRQRRKLRTLGFSVVRFWADQLDDDDRLLRRLKAVRSRAKTRRAGKKQQ